MKRGDWAIWHKEVIVDIDGESPYLTRRRIVMTPWFSLYAHQIHRADWDRALHDHPWAFISLVWRGGYVEECVDIPAGQTYGYGTKYERYRGLFTIRSTPLTRAHRISVVKPNTRTLVLTGRRRHDSGWGFWESAVQTEHIPWRDYLRQIGHPQAEDR